MSEDFTVGAFLVLFGGVVVVVAAVPATATRKHAGAAALPHAFVAQTRQNGFSRTRRFVAPAARGGKRAQGNAHTLTHRLPSRAVGANRCFVAGADAEARSVWFWGSSCSETPRRGAAAMLVVALVWFHRLWFRYGETAMHEVFASEAIDAQLTHSLTN